MNLSSFNFLSTSHGTYIRIKRFLFNFSGISLEIPPNEFQYFIQFFPSAASHRRKLLPRFVQKRLCYGNMMMMSVTYHSYL